MDVRELAGKRCVFAHVVNTTYSAADLCSPAPHKKQSIIIIQLDSGHSSCVNVPAAQGRLRRTSAINCSRSENLLIISICSLTHTDVVRLMLACERLQRSSDRPEDQVLSAFPHAKRVSRTKTHFSELEHWPCLIVTRDQIREAFAFSRS